MQPPYPGPFLLDALYIPGCMYISVCESIHVCKYPLAALCIHGCMYMCMRTYAYVYAYINAWIHVDAYTYIHISKRAHRHIHTYKCINTHTDTYVYICLPQRGGGHGRRGDGVKESCDRRPEFARYEFVGVVGIEGLHLQRIDFCFYEISSRAMSS